MRLHGRAVVASTCLFCGESGPHLKPAELGPDDLLPGRRAVPSVDAEACRAAFRTWVAGHWMVPGRLASARLELRLVYVPALRFRGRLETHWLGRVSDRSCRSGYRPRSGVDDETVEDAFVTASRTLYRHEMRGLGPFGDAYEAVDADALAEPVEVGALSPRALRSQGLAELKARHALLLQARHGLSELQVAAVDHELDSEVVLVPVWIGAYRHRGRPWRWLANGVTGRVVGTPPRSRLKWGLALAVFLSLFTVNPLPLLVWAGYLGLWALGVVDD